MTLPRQHSIFGGTERARIERSSTVHANGYAAKPGTGPAGESCGTCANCRMRHLSAQRRVYKCALAMSGWNSSRSSDVLIHSPACEKWTPGEPHSTTIQIRSR